MKHFWSLEYVHEKNTCLTIGTFDGVHKGHQEIIRQLKQEARKRGEKAVVLTFFPHPAIILGRRNSPSYLTTPQERAKLLLNYGADLVITYPFTRLTSKKTASQFVDEIYKHLQMKCLFVGHDFALGHEREGTPEKLAYLGKSKGFLVKVVKPVIVNDIVVSSSVIRKMLSEGKVEDASFLLGRNYTIDGFVVRGDHRAKSLGFPTANLSTWKQRVQIKNGVYACRAYVLGRMYQAVANIGVRPTFYTAGQNPQIEAHLIDFSEEIYGKYLQLEFVARLRDEKKFESPSCLREQIREDIEMAISLLATKEK